MKNVLIDNWMLEEVVLDLNDVDKLLRNESFHNLLESMILWDNVYFPQNEYSGFWSYMSQETDLKKHLKPCIDNNKFYIESNKMYVDNFANQYNDKMACGAIRYSLLADSLGYDYMPCNQRGEFIRDNKVYSLLYEDKKIHFNSQLNRPFNRIDICEPINYEVKKYFEEFNQYYKGDFFEFTMPVLANYIIGTKPDNLSYFEYVMKIKNKLSVKQFLNYLTQIEKSISQGNFVPCNRFRKDIMEIVDEICNMDKHFNATVDTQLIMKPILNFDIFKIRRINYSFIKKLIKYSI